MSDDGLIPGDLYCVLCDDDIIEDDEVPEKTVDTKDGRKAHLDCYLRLKRFPTEFIDQVMAGKITVRQTEPGGPVVVIHDLLPDEDR